MKKYWYLAAMAALAAGCGGGGGGSTPGGGDDSQTLDLGPIVTNVSGAIPAPLITSGSNVVVTGVAGGRVNDLRVKQPPMTSLTAQEVANQTFIGFNELGRAALFQHGTGNVFTISSGSGSSASIESYTDISPDGTKVVSSEFVGLNLQIFIRNSDGSSPVQLTSGGGFNYVIPRFTPDGTKILYSRGTPLFDSAKIYSMKLDGTNKTVLSNGPVDFSGTMSPDGQTIAFYRRDADGTNSSIWKMNADGSGRSQILAPDPMFEYFPLIDWAPAGTDIVFSTRSTGGTTATIRKFNTAYDASEAPPTTLYTAVDSIIYSPTWSPDGLLIAFGKAAPNGWELDEIPAFGASEPTTLLTRPSIIVPSWGPYVQERKFVGTAPNVFGASQGGFLFGQQGSLVTSLVSFDAVTRSGVTLQKQTDQNPNQPNVIVTIQSSDELNALQYVNSLTATPTKVITGTTSTHATGAIVSFDSNTGRVASIIPYGDLSGNSKMMSNSSNQVKITGHLLGIWDADGKNIAPSGAGEVVIDGKTGALISHK